MFGTQPWTRIGTGDGDTVLVVDFDVTGRPEATFRDLVRLLPAELSVWQAAPPDHGSWTAVPADRYLRWWRDYPGAGRRPVRAVAGYCAGSVFARVLAAEIAARQDRPPVLLLFNPGAPTVRTLDRDFRKLVESMPLLTDPERDALREEVRRLGAAAGEDFSALSSAFVRLYREAGATAFERLGLDEEVAAELVGLFASYVSYLAAARSLDPDPDDATAVALTSHESDSADGYTGNRIEFDVGRDKLLSSPKVAAVAAELITSPELSLKGVSSL